MATSSCDPPAELGADEPAEKEPNPLKLDPPNPPAVEPPNTEVAAAAAGVVDASEEVVGTDSGSGTLGGLPNPNPTGFPKLPLFAAPPNPLNVGVGLGNEVEKPPALLVTEEELRGFIGVFPKKLFELELVSFSFSSEDQVDLPNGDADAAPNALLDGELPNRDGVGLGSESPDSSGLAGEKECAVAMELNADLLGAEPKENGELDVEVKPVVVVDDEIVFPPKPKLVTGFGMPVVTGADDPKPDPPDPLNRVEEGAGEGEGEEAGAGVGAGLLLGRSSKSFWTESLNFL